VTRLAPILAVSLALCGCQTAPERPVIGSAPSTTVTVPLPVSCVDAAQIPPVRPSAIPAKGADVARLAAGASADVRQLRVDNATMRALLMACAGAPK
jgi:hypothetical protein